MEIHLAGRSYHVRDWLATHPLVVVCLDGCDPSYLRDFTHDRHRVVDDVPYGGGPGMVLKADPMFRALDAIEAGRGRPAALASRPSALPLPTAKRAALCHLSARAPPRETMLIKALLALDRRYIVCAVSNDVFASRHRGTGGT